MNPRSLILMALAAVGVLIVVLLTRNYLNTVISQNQQVQPVVKETPAARILVAARTLRVGTILKEEDIKWQDWPEKGLSEAYFAAPQEKIKPLAGKVVRTPLTAGEPVTRASLVSQGDRGFMAAILTPGMRAVTVQLSPTSSVGGFIFPGDRVDVILSQSVPVPGTRIPYVVSETVFQNVRVLGVDQRSTANEDQVRIAKTATLEVTPKMAEKVAMLSSLGTLSLSLRSLAAGNDGLSADPNSPPVSETLTFTGSPEVSNFRPDLNPDDDVARVIVKRGSNVSVVTPKAGGSPDGPPSDERSEDDTQ